MGKKSKSKKAGPVSRTVKTVASVFSPTKKVGLAKKGLTAGLGIAKSVLGGSAKAPPKKRRFSINKATNKLLEAKIKGKIMKEKIKVVNSIR